ncbi:hypothetical protein K488DRAFT_21855, partial [Vararia minispora EC-137]
MASSLSQLSASVTRILSLTGFPKELKTRDIQAAFSEWENASGGFKIKWIDDTSLLIVFADATVAKRAYLQTLANPPAVFSSPTSDTTAIIRPYDGPDAQSIIQNVNARSGQRGHNARTSSLAIPNARRPNGGPPSAGPNGPVLTLDGLNIPAPATTNGRDGSPTLPNLPSHPTLDSLINSSLGDVAHPPADPAIVAASPIHTNGNANSLGPRIGDPAKRMMGAALGIRHPSLGPR